MGSQYFLWFYSNEWTQIQWSAIDVKKCQETSFIVSVWYDLVYMTTKIFIRRYNLKN